MAMRDVTCTVRCANRNEITRVCSWMQRGNGPCDYGFMANVLHNSLGDLGEWKMLHYKDGPIKATLRGRCGIVEVWGGRHAREVWFIERSTKAETLLCESWAVTDGSLREAVKRGCSMAGIQTQMAIE